MFKVFKCWLQKLFKKETDPVKLLPKDVVELVFSFMSGNDLLRCSKVNKSWLKFIGKSEKCMRKMRFVVCEPYHGMIWKFTEADVHNMVKNGRKYQHVALFISRNMTKDHLLLVASFEWKSVNLCHHTFKSEIELTNFLGLIEPFVEELDLKHVRIVFSKEMDIAAPNFIFPKLKKLKVSYCCTFILSEILRNVESIEVLEIETGTLSCDDIDDLYKRIKAIEVILNKNVKIRNLSLFLHQLDFDGIFMDQRFLKRLRFRLEIFKVKKFKRLEGKKTNIVQVSNFIQFITTHKNTMTSLTMYDCLGNNVLEAVINDMERLKSVEFGDLSSYEKLEESIANINFYKNESIENLTMYTRSSEFCEIQNNLLTRVPNLKTLNIGTVNQRILETLIVYTPKLLKLKLDYFSAYWPPERAVLNELKEITITAHYASNFKDQLRDFTNYTNFEKAFLKATKLYDKYNHIVYWLDLRWDEESEKLMKLRLLSLSTRSCLWRVTSKNYKVKKRN